MKLKLLKKVIRNTFIIGLILVVLLTVAGFSYEIYGGYVDSNKYKPPGKIIKINGHNMHIYGEGTGEATVVFASGWGIPSPYAEYYPLHGEIAKHTRTVVYDRPGYGWSELSKNPRDIDTIAEEIHQLMEKSGEKPPYILVGHSIASLEVLRFAQLYKDEVKGIILLDGGNPEYYLDQSQSEKELSNISLKLLLKKTGVLRLLFNNSPGFLNAINKERNNLAYLPEELKELDKAMYLKNLLNNNIRDEINNKKINSEKVIKGGNIGDIPLIILTAESEATNDSKWLSSQKALKNWSTKSEQKVIKDTKHNMHQYKPDIINKEVLDVLNSMEK